MMILKAPKPGPGTQPPSAVKQTEVFLMRRYELNVFKYYVEKIDNLEKEKDREVRFLLDELLETDVKPDDWRELFISLIKHLGDFKNKWDVLRHIYKFLIVRYDYTATSKVVWKIAKRFNLLFEKSEVYDGLDFSYRGLELFSKLMNPLDKKPEVHKEEPGLFYFLQKFGRRVRA